MSGPGWPFIWWWEHEQLAYHAVECVWRHSWKAKKFMVDHHIDRSECPAVRGSKSTVCLWSKLEERAILMDELFNLTPIFIAEKVSNTCSNIWKHIKIFPKMLLQRIVSNETRRVAACAFLGEVSTPVAWKTPRGLKANCWLFYEEIVARWYKNSPYR
jgi:hypothetical protein